MLGRFMGGVDFTGIYMLCSFNWQCDAEFCQSPWRLKNTMNMYKICQKICMHMVNKR